MMESTNKTAVENTQKKSSKRLVILIIGVVLAVLAYTQLTIFVIQPIGAVPDGRTLVMLRGSKTQFIDSADAMCERMQGGVNLICRMGVMGAVGGNATILMRLPYSESLYLISTAGKTYDR